jgi:hypothetical protein
MEFIGMSITEAPACQTGTTILGPNFASQTLLRLEILAPFSASSNSGAIFRNYQVQYLQYQEKRLTQKSARYDDDDDDDDTITNIYRYSTVPVPKQRTMTGVFGDLSSWIDGLIGIKGSSGVSTAVPSNEAL